VAGGVPRSQVLFHRQLATVNDAVAFTCPANTVTLVKSFYAANYGTTASTIIFYCQAGTGGAQITLLRQSLAAGTFASWQGFQVLNPTDAVLALADNGQINTWCSGAVLLGPPPFPPGTMVLDVINVLPA
jgi:hypothetical protein